MNKHLIAMLVLCALLWFIGVYVPEESAGASFEDLFR